jgi:hypothetical protein
MTKEEILDSVDFAVRRLGEVSTQLKRIESILTEPHPEFEAPDKHLKVCAYALGRSQGIADEARAALDFITQELSDARNGVRRKCLSVNERTTRPNLASQPEFNPKKES